MNKLQLALESIASSERDSSNRDPGHQLRLVGVALESYLDDVDGLCSAHQALNGVLVTMESVSEPTAIHYRNAHAVVGEILSKYDIGLESVGLESLGLEAERPGAWATFVAFVKSLLKKIMEMLGKLKDFLGKLFRTVSVDEKIAIAKITFLRKKLATVRHGLTINAVIPGRPSHLFALPSKVDQSGNVVTTVFQSDAIKYRELAEHLRAYSARMSALHVDVAKSVFEVIQVVGDQIDVIVNTAVDPERASAVIEESRNVIVGVREVLRNHLIRGVVASGMTPDGNLHLAHDRQLNLVVDTLRLSTEPGNDPFSAPVSPSAFRVHQISSDRVKLPEDFGWEAMQAPEIEALLKMATHLLEEMLSSNVKRIWAKNINGVSAITAQTSMKFDRAMAQESLPPEARDVLVRLTGGLRNAGRLSIMPYVDLVSVNMRVVNALIALASDALDNVEANDSSEKRAEDAERLRAVREQAANLGKPRGRR